MENKSKIFVIYHKAENPIFSDVYQPLLVGSNKHSNNIFLYDDVGENISLKNKVYNEMTGIYWVFSHLNEFADVEYIGFSHYRRLFCFNGNKMAYVRKNTNNNLVEVNGKVINDIFTKYGFIAPRPNHYKSVKKHYEKSHNKEDVELLIKCIEQISPKYIKDAIEYLNGNNEYLYNMFVFKKESFIEYGNFIFPILDKFVSLKPNIDRLYVSERLTGVFIYHLIKQGFTPYFLPILHVRSKSIRAAFKQIKESKDANKKSSLFFKFKPLLLCLLPRWFEQILRRKKAK